MFAYKKISYAQHNEDTENSQIECNIVPIAPRISGYIDQIYVKENQRVHKGDTILKLDDRDLKIRLQQAFINAKSAGANVSVVKVMLHPQMHLPVLPLLLSLLHRQI
ncbi:MAG: biotin/lipoyl-binding protein [Sphingobacteriales bacterium]|nr:biotin/lipoyl-binding protein [Sphingobacteriales bacterium]